MADKSRQTIIMEARKLGISVAPEDQIADIQQKIIEYYEAKEREEEDLKREAYYIDNDLVRIKVSATELAELQDTKKLIGYDPRTKEAIVKSTVARKFAPPSQPELPPVSQEVAAESDDAGSPGIPQTDKGKNKPGKR